MRYTIIVAMLLFCSAVGYGQCTSSTGYQCVPQADMDRIAKDLNELKVLKDAYQKLLTERALTDAERTAAQNVIKISQDTVAIFQQGVADRDKVIELQQKALTLYAELVQKLTDQLNKPKSAWSKFLTALKEIAYLAAGVVIGRQF